MMQTPDLFSVRKALESALFAALTAEQAAGNVIIIQPGEDLKPDLKKIQVIHSVNPGKVMDGELGGRLGICPRVGVYTVTLSSLQNDIAKYTKEWKLCSLIEKAFRRKELPIEDSNCKVMCDEPYTMNVGKTDDKRLALSVSIPWWVWAGGHEGE